MGKYESCDDFAHGTDAMMIYLANITALTKSSSSAAAVSSKSTATTPSDIITTKGGGGGEKQVDDGGTTTIVCGGDTVAAIQSKGFYTSYSHVSTGGGAALELLEGDVLPGVDALNDEEEVALADETGTAAASVVVTDLIRAPSREIVAKK